MGKTTNQALENYVEEFSSLFEVLACSYCLMLQRRRKRDNFLLQCPKMEVLIQFLLKMVEKGPKVMDLFRLLLGTKERG